MVENGLSRAESSERFNAHLLEKIILCDIDAVIKLITDKVYRIEDKELKKSLILFCYCFNRLKKQTTNGIIKKEDEFHEEIKIVERLVEQILQISEPP